jgi:hypothetical protein
MKGITGGGGGVGSAVVPCAGVKGEDASAWACASEEREEKREKSKINRNINRLGVLSLLSFFIFNFSLFILRTP